MDKETSPTSPTQPVSLLSDQPASSDEFNAGAHGKVAAAIAHLVRTEQGGRAIGLEGTWGSGKSTVVRIMRDALVEEGADVDIETVVFDAWAHQGDPLRRTFLEKLADGLEAAGWLNRDATKDLRAKLS